MQEITINVASTQIASFVTIALTMLLGIGGVVLLATARRKCLFLFFAGVAALPLVAGAIGMIVGYGEVRERVAQLGEVALRSNAVETAFAHARMPLYIGAGGFGALLIVSLAGLLLCKDICKDKEPEEADQKKA